MPIYTVSFSVEIEAESYEDAYVVRDRMFEDIFKSVDEVISEPIGIDVEKLYE